MKTPEQERERIVSYLLETAEIFRRDGESGKTGPLVAKHHRESCTYAAEAIQRGEHWEGVE